MNASTNTSMGARRRRTLVLWFARLALTLLAVTLIQWANRVHGDYLALASRSFSPTTGMWRWFVAAVLATLAGATIALASRSHPPGRRFRAGRVTPVVILPLLLAMTWPVFVWDWYRPSMGSWLGSVNSTFSSWPMAMIMWLIVGVGIASGFDNAGES